MSERFISDRTRESRTLRPVNNASNDCVQSIMHESWVPPPNWEKISTEKAPIHTQQSNAPRIGARAEIARDTPPIFFDHSSLYDSGAKATDTQRQVNVVNRRQHLQIGIALSRSDNNFADNLSKLQALPAGKIAEVSMIGISAFSRELCEQAAQIMNGVHDGTGHFVEAAIGNVGKVAQATWITARSAMEVETDPMQVSKKIAAIGAEATVIAHQLQSAAHQRFDATTHYYNDARSGKVQPIHDAESLALKSGKAAVDAYQRWEAQPTYDKTKQAVEIYWGFSMVDVVEGIAVLKAAGTRESVVGLNAIRQRLDSMEALFAKYEKSSVVPPITENVLAKNTVKRLKMLGKSGKGGDWPVINERISDDVVRQTERYSCVSACAEMLTNGALKQSKLIKQLGSPSDAEALARALGPSWKAKSVTEQSLDALLRGEGWAAELRELAPASNYRRLEIAHTVVIDGLNELGNIMIRDPADGTRYEMTRRDFLKHWNLMAVYRCKL